MSSTERPWFVGADVPTSLFGGTSGKSDLYRTLDAQDMTKVRRTDLGCGPGKAMVLVSEPGLYRMILRSEKSEARSFQDWITREVLPSIRKTGTYALADHGREAMFVLETWEARRAG